MDGYTKDGFQIFETDLKETLIKLRQTFVEIFNVCSTNNSLSSIYNDSDIERMYRSKHRDLWVSAYDQLRNIPELLSLVNNPIFIKQVKNCGIKIPVVNEIVVRGDMPNDDDWLRGKHQDYGYNQGSMNSVVIWIPFQEIDDLIGPLLVQPGSHLNGVLPNQGEDIPDSKFIPVNLELGKGLIFSQFLVHSSGKNRSSKIRFSLQIRYNDLGMKEYAKRKFYFPKKKQIDPPDINFPTYFPIHTK